MTVMAGILGEEEKRARDYRGMNPAFVRKVWAKRRAKRAAPPPAPPPRKKTIGEILAERADERRARLDAERIAKLKARIEEGGVVAIIAEAALAHGFTLEDILSVGRSKPLVKARHEAIVEVAIRKPAFSLSQIGRFFHRDHTSILHVLQKYGIRSAA